MDEIIINLQNQTTGHERMKPGDRLSANPEGTK
jgi:hypothetical protein